VHEGLGDAGVHFTDILKKLRFSVTSISLAMVLIFGRMVSPGSERHTIEWFKKRSALQELTGSYKSQELLQRQVLRGCG